MQDTEATRLIANKRRLIKLWLCSFILAIGLIGAFYIKNNKQVENNQRIQKSLSSRLEQISQGVQSKIILYQYGLSGLRASIMSLGPEQFGYTQMQNYVASRDYENEFPGARGFGFIRFVLPETTQYFIDRAKSDRPDNTFAIRQLNVNNSSLFVIQYIEPEYNNKSAVGLDIGSEEMRRAAAIEAAKTNTVHLTGPITLVQAENKELHGFLILMPVYNTLKAPESERSRLSNLVGWTYAPILIDEVLDSLIDSSEDLVLTIEDEAKSNQTTFFTNDKGTSKVSNYIATQSISFLGRYWNLKLTAKNSFIDSLQLPSPVQSFMEVMGVTMLFILGLFVVHITMSRNIQIKQHRGELALEREKTLTAVNLNLEREIAARTEEISRVNVLQRSILKGAGYAIIATDENGLITVFNPAAELLLGYSSEEVVGIHTPALMHLQDEVVSKAEQLSQELSIEIQPGFEVFVAKARQGELEVNQWTYVDKFGQHIPVRLSISSLCNDEGQTIGFLGIAFDLTEQIKHEKELAEAKELAEQSNIIKSQFLANMSHEIRTPLNGIYGALQLFKEEQLTASGKDFLEKSIYSIDKLIVIINDILDFSKIEAGKLNIENSTFKLSLIIEHLMTDMHHTAKKKNISMRLIKNVSHDYWVGDSIRIQQILINIISNAIKFTPSGEVCFTVEYSESSGKMTFIISDTGIGMDQAALDHLFVRFEQADASTTRKFGGTGLGLPISQSLITLMGGEITVESEVDVGTSFRVSLPLVKSIQENEPFEILNAEALDFNNKVILIAEDNEINQAIIAAMLEKTKAQLSFAENGLIAIEFVKQKLPDLILMDIQMPEMDGIEACSKIKQLWPNIPIIALTANVMAEDMKKYTNVGFDGHIAKPVQQDKLINEIAQHLGK